MSRFRSSGYRREDGSEDLERCEDGEPICDELRSGVVCIAVADGLGGRGRPIHGESAAKVASRAALEALKEIVARSDPFTEKPADFAVRLTRGVRARLSSIVAHQPTSRLRGATANQRLATTLAGCLVRTAPDGRANAGPSAPVRAFWIGDSRTYLLTATALHQLSFDDSEVLVDALESILNDAPMSQFASDNMDPRWTIHCVDLHALPPGLLVTCTDGCFSYLSAPWEWERMLLRALRQAQDWDGFARHLRAEVDKVKADDATMAAIPLHTATFDRIKEIVLGERGERSCDVAAKIAASGPSGKADAWLDYRIEYERFLPRTAPEKLAELATRRRRVEQAAVPRQSIPMSVPGPELRPPESARVQAPAEDPSSGPAPLRGVPRARYAEDPLVEALVQGSDVDTPPPAEVAHASRIAGAPVATCNDGPAPRLAPRAAQAAARRQLAFHFLTATLVGTVSFVAGVIAGDGLTGHGLQSALDTRAAPSSSTNPTVCEPAPTCPPTNPHGSGQAPLATPDGSRTARPDVSSVANQAETPPLARSAPLARSRATNNARSAPKPPPSTGSALEEPKDGGAPATQHGQNGPPPKLNDAGGS